MPRLSVITAALVCALALPAGSIAAHPGSQRAGAADVPLHPATGNVIEAGSYQVTIQTNGRRMGVINALTATANRIMRRNYTYVWGGGHAAAGIASVGSRGPGYTGRRSGFDCSGSVAAVLAGGGLWPPGGGVPNDAGVVGQLLAEHLIARGAGTGPHQVTLYDQPGVHIFMSIDGRFFGTSDGAGGGSVNGGPGWLDDGAADAFRHSFRQYHVLPWVLHERTSYGHDLTFQTTADPPLVAALGVGDRVHVSYSNATGGRMILRALTYAGSQTTSGVVASVGPGNLVVLPTTTPPTPTPPMPTQPTLTFSVPGDGSLLHGIVLGDTVTVTYTAHRGAALARTIVVTAPPAASVTTPTTPTAPTTPTTPATPGAGDPTQPPSGGPPAVTDPSQSGTGVPSQ